MSNVTIKIILENVAGGRTIIPIVVKYGTAPTIIFHKNRAFYRDIDLKLINNLRLYREIAPISMYRINKETVKI